MKNELLHTVRSARFRHGVLCAGSWLVLGCYFGCVVTMVVAAIFLSFVACMVLSVRLPQRLLRRRRS